MPASQVRNPMLVWEVRSDTWIFLRPCGRRHRHTCLPCASTGEPQSADGAAIDVQKMNWKFRIGVHEQTGVCLYTHVGHDGTGGYTHESQNTDQCYDCQSFIRQVATGLPQRRCAFGAADHGVDRPPGAPCAHGSAVRALGPQFLLSLRLAEDLS